MTQLLSHQIESRRMFRVAATIFAVALLAALIDVFVIQAALLALAACYLAALFSLHLFFCFLLRKKEALPRVAWRIVTTLAVATFSMAGGALHDLWIEADTLHLAAEIESYKVKNGKYPLGLAELGIPLEIIGSQSNATRFRRYLVLYTRDQIGETAHIRFDRFNHQRQSYDIRARAFGPIVDI